MLLIYFTKLMAKLGIGGIDQKNICIKELFMPVLFTRMSSGLSGYSSSQKGFTLIEMMIAITIMGILLVIASPSIENSLQKQRNRESTQTLVAALRDARTESQLLQKDVTLSYNNSDNTVTLMTSALGANAGNNITLRSYNLNSRSGITASDEVVFRANKTTNKAVAFDVFCDKSKTKQGRQVSVDVNGNVSISEENSQC